MPRASQRSEAAKLKRQSAHNAFGKRSRCDLSPERSEYCISDSSSNDSIECLGSNINRDETEDESEKEVEAAIVTVQSLYSWLLPPHLRRERKTPAMQETPEMPEMPETPETPSPPSPPKNRRRIGHRGAIYTGNSRTSVWRKEAAHRNAAKSCATLDPYVVRKVCKSQPIDMQ